MSNEPTPLKRALDALNASRNTQSDLQGDPLQFAHRYESPLDQELAAVNQNTLINDAQFARLNAWVDKHYRDQLTEDDLRDPQLLIESRTALDELTQLLKLGSVYPFQQD